jgi:hypothetical protein
MRCGSCGAAPAVRLLRCGSCGAAPAVRLVRCGSCGAAPAVRLVRCGSCGAASAPPASGASAFGGLSSSGSMTRIAPDGSAEPFAASGLYVTRTTRSVHHDSVSPRLRVAGGSIAPSSTGVVEDGYCDALTAGTVWRIRAILDRTPEWLGPRPRIRGTGRP